MNLAEELEKLGIAGPARMRQLLGKPKKVDPLVRAINKFRDDNSIAIDSLPNALKILDLHGVKRIDVHEQAISEVNDKLISRIRYLGAENTEESTTKLLKQLDKCFHLYTIPYFRNVVLETLKHLPLVPENYLNEIIADPSLYRDCAISVKQQIWLDHKEMFVASLSPIIESYISEKMALECNIDQANTNFFTCETTKSRRQWSQVQELIEMVGTHEVLYEGLIRLIRESFVETSNSHLCCLRTEVTMAIHDMNVDTIIKYDACHDFAWSLDASIRDKHLDGTHSVKLKHILDTIKSGQVEVLSDMAMIAADLHVVHFLTTTVVKKLKDSAMAGTHLPRDVVSIQLMIRILSLGAAAHDISSKGQVPNEFVDSIFFTKFLSIFQSLVLEDAIRIEMIRTATSDIEDFHVSALLQPVSYVIHTFLRTNVVAALIWLHYLIDLLPTKRRTGDIKGLQRYFSVLPLCKDKLPSRGVWCHLLAHSLIQSNQFESALLDQPIQHILVESMLLTAVQTEYVVKYQLLRIINLIGFIWGVKPCQDLMERIDPQLLMSVCSESDIVRYRVDFARVAEKLNPRPIVPPGELSVNLMSPTKTASMSGLGSPPVRQYPPVGMISTPRSSLG